MCQLSDFADLHLTPYHRRLLEGELAAWHEHYLPILPGATVLDVGAGCGETARFYLLHGASRVIAVEGAPDAYRLLEANFAGDERVVPIFAPLNKIKIDAEGAECGMDLEVHFPFRLLSMRRAAHVEQLRLVPDRR